MKQALIAAAALLSLAACSGTTSPTNPSAALPALTRPQLGSDLYVADQGLDSVVEFDSQGNKLAQKSLGPQPLDVVTDSRGNVYLLTAELVVHELTHNLGRVIRQYSPTSDFTAALAIDANDNLYIQGSNYKTGYLFVAEYAYGSSKVAKVYTMPIGCYGCSIGGIAVRGNRLFLAVESQNPSSLTTLYGCSLQGPSDCKSLMTVGITGLHGCGFTTTGRFAVYGNANQRTVEGFHPYTSVHISKSIVLPPYYGLGNDHGFCNLHNSGALVWGGMKTSKGSPPAVAVEFDMANGKVAATIGAGILSMPVAAYYGNGFVP